MNLDSVNKGSGKINRMGEGTTSKLEQIPNRTEGTLIGTKESAKSWGTYAVYQTNIPKFQHVMVPSYESPNAEEFPGKVMFVEGKITVV